MTVAALRAELEREDALWGLTMMRKAEAWERWELAEPLVEQHLQPGSRIRVSAAVMPPWYRAQWAHDPTQLDGLAVVAAVNSLSVRLRGRGLHSGELDTSYSLQVIAFLDAVLAGTIGDG